MRINTSGLYTAAFYKITDLDEGVECFSDLGEIKLYGVFTAAPNYNRNLQDEINKKSILIQPTKFSVEAALRCDLIPFDVGNLKGCLVYNSFDYPSNINWYVNLDLYQALTDKSIDPNGHLAKVFDLMKENKGIYNRYIKDGFEAMALVDNSFMENSKNKFTDLFSKELLEKVYNALITAEG